MKSVTRFLSAAALASLLAALALPAFTISTLATPCSSVFCNTKGAPGPIAGAGLPFLAVGYGVYWLIERRRKAD